MQIPAINLEAIPDLATRQIVVQVLNRSAAQAADIATLRVENQQLRDANARLKGGSGKPDRTPSVKPAPSDHAEEAERQVRTPRGKPTKHCTLTVTREQRCVVDPATLPPDARFNGMRETIVQDVVIQGAVIRFVREEWYVPSTTTTILAPLPPGYHGAFGPTIHSVVPSLNDGANVSQPALHTLLGDVGVSIGTGTVARMLRDPDGRWAEDAAAVHATGMASGTWGASDQTSTRVDGQNDGCHGVGNALFTSSHTRPGGTRHDVLAILWGQEPVFRLHDEAVAWLEATSLPHALRKRLLAGLPWDSALTDAELRQHLTNAGMRLNQQQQQQVWDALAVAAYHAQTGVPVLQLLLRDDAAGLRPPDRDARAVLGA